VQCSAQTGDQASKDKSVDLSALLSVIGSALFAVGGGAFIVATLSKYLGGIWANRILENEKARETREQELLIRRRNIYAKLARALRVLLSSNDPITLEHRREFLAAYDEAALWATEDVICAVGVLIDINKANSAKPGSVSMEAYRAAYAHSITAMRRDSGFPDTEYQHRIVSF
jgi:hypothetical protein